MGGGRKIEKGSGREGERERPREEERGMGQKDSERGERRRVAGGGGGEGGTERVEGDNYPEDLVPLIICSPSSLIPRFAKWRRSFVDLILFLTMIHVCCVKVVFMHSVYICA